MLQKVANKLRSNDYYKRLSFRIHLVSLLYGLFSYCNGLRELWGGMLACEGKLAHLGLDKAPARSTLSDANTRRSYLYFELVYNELLKQYHSFISDSRLKGLSIRNLKIIDSTTIRLFSDLLRGVGRNPIDGYRKRGGIKVHTMMDAFSGVAEFVRMTEAKVHDRKFLYHLDLPANSFIVFDKAYNLYAQFAKWSEDKIWFVPRMKDNAVFDVNKVMVDNTKKKNAKELLKEQYITIAYKNTKGDSLRMSLRRITFRADDGKVYIF